MRSKKIFKHRGYQRIIIVSLAIYLLVMLIPLNGWPNPSIRNQVTIDHCFGIDKHRKIKYENYLKWCDNGFKGDTKPSQPEEEIFATQLRILPWLWLTINILIWPTIIFSLLESYCWIADGFSKPKEDKK